MFTNPRKLFQDAVIQFRIVIECLKISLKECFNFTQEGYIFCHVLNPHEM